MPKCTAFLAARIAIGPFSPIFIAISIAFLIPPSKSSVTWFTNPMFKAYSAVSRSPVKINSLARDTPINLDSLYVPPAPGIIASPVSGKEKIAYMVATLISLHSASSQPPPIAGPSTTDIVGHSIYSNIENVALSLRTKVLTSISFIVFLSFKSAPAQNIPAVELLRITHFAVF